MTRRKPTAGDRILAALRTGPKVTHELASPAVGGVRFGARLQELREAGHTIREERVRQSQHRYTLVREAGADGGGTIPGPAGSDGSSAATVRNRPPLAAAPVQTLPERWWNVCDKCGHRFPSLPHPRSCEECQAEVHWLSSFYVKHAADRHVPLVEQERAA